MTEAQLAEKRAELERMEERFERMEDDHLPANYPNSYRNFEARMNALRAEIASNEAVTAA